MNITARVEVRDLCFDQGGSEHMSELDQKSMVEKPLYSKTKWKQSCWQPLDDNLD